jgi:hypothetical protein
VIRLPPPVTFEDGQRKLYGILMSRAGVGFGLASLAAASVIIWGDWPAGLAELRLYFVGGALLLAGAGSIAVTVALAVGGPVGRFKVDVSKTGVAIDASDHTVTTTTTETKAP